MLPKLMLPKLLPRCGAMLRCRARGISGLTLPVLRVGAPSTALRQPLRQAARALASASAPSPGGSHPFLLADIGEGIAEVEVLQWFVGPGDTVEQFDRVCEVQSDKATVEISSPYVGRIESIAYAVGSIAKVGTPLLHIVLEGTATEPAAGSSAPAAGGALAAAAAAAAAPGLATAAGGRLPPGKALATPATRAMAKQHGIDLSTLVGTGREGRVTKEDVLAVLSGPAPASPPAVTAPSAVTAPPRTPAPATATTAPAPAAAMPAPPSPPRRNAATSDYEVAIKGIRKAMFAQMTAALAVPHFGYCDEVRMDELMAVRQQLKVAAAEAGLPKFTLMPLIVRATSLALAQHPELSASISADGTKLLVKASHNIGVAMDTPQGLLVPNIKNVASLTLFEIAQELARLQRDASAGKLSVPDLKGGTFTLSNIGNLGGTYTGPVINQPEIAIAGLGKTRATPKYDEAGNLVKASIMQVSWAADHRVVDGAMMARFSNTWIGLLEKPATMLLHL